MDQARIDFELREVEHGSTPDIIRGALKATWRLAQIEIDLAKDEMQQHLRAAVIACSWAVAAFGLLILTLATVVLTVTLASDSELLVAGTVAVAAAVAALVAGGIAFRMRPQRLMQRTRERLERERALLRKVAR